MGPIIEILVLMGCLGVGSLLAVHLIFDTRNKIGFVAMPKVTIRTLIEALELKPEDVLIDLGAGDGRVLAAALRAEPGIRAIGYENNPVLRHPAGVQWQRKDLFKADLTEATKVVAYLHPDLNTRLLPKFEQELAKGTKVVTVQFELVGRVPERTIKVSGAPGYAAKVFVYRF